MRKLQLLVLLFVLAIGRSEAQCPSAPQLLEPAGGADDVPLTVTLSWSNVGAEAYDIYLATDGACSTAQPAATAQGTSFNPPPLQPDTSYEWRVVAKKANCAPQTSTCRRFKTARTNTPSCPTSAPVLRAPANNAVVQGSLVELRWERTEGSTYAVFAGLDGAAPTLVAITAEDRIVRPVTASRVEWYVEARTPNCAPMQSERWQFSMAAVCPNSGPGLVAPLAGATVSSPVEFKWTAVAGATSYALYVAYDADAFTQIGETRGTSLTQTTELGNITWYVEAKVPGCGSFKSPTARFLAQGAQSCPAVSLRPLTPAETTAVSPVSFSWTEVPGATYRLWGSTEGGAPAILAKTDTNAAKVALPAGNLEWFVEALRTNCQPLVSNRRVITIQQSANCSDAQPVLTAPVSTSSTPLKVGEKVTFQWNSVAGAIGYRVWISRDGGAFADVSVTVATQLLRELEEGVYTWYVEALFSGCRPVASARTAFEVDDNRERCASDSAVLLSPPAATEVSSPVSFAWTAVARAERYRVYLTNGSTTLMIGETSDTSLERALPPGVYAWSVETVFEECPSTRSQPAAFRIATSASCGAEKASPLSPAGEVSHSDEPVAFSWTAISNAVRYVLMVQRDGGAATAVGETADTSLSRRLPPGSYDWWVVAFLRGCPTTVSDKVRITITRAAECPVLAPSIVAPLDGTTSTSRVEFSWTPVRGAKWYRVRSLLDSGDSPILALTEEPQVTRELPVGRHRWYVEAIFEGCSPLQSAVSTLTIVPRQAACAVPPAPDARVIGRPLSGNYYAVRWEPVQGADLYEVQESATADFATVVSQATPYPYASFLHGVTSPTRYYYRVRGASSCSDDRGQYSDVVSALVIPADATSAQRHATYEAGSFGGPGMTVFVPGSSPAVPFTAVLDQPFLTVTPSSGTLGPEGVTLKLVPSTDMLRRGTNTATLRIIEGSAGKGLSPSATTSPVIPVSVSLVSPVTPSGKSTPPPDAFIIPAVAHAEGANSSMFESDVRIANLGAQAMRYQLNFTPSGVDGTTTGNASTIEIAAGATMAIDDILATFFGTSGAVTGTLEIRPITTTTTSSALFSTSAPSAQLTTVASSRTFNSTPTGTFGQFIPAIRYADFIGKSTTTAKTILSLQQVAQSVDYRTNVGLGKPRGRQPRCCCRCSTTRT